MISVDDALQHVLARARPRSATVVPLAEACDRVLAEDVTSDIDSPPHDKSLVDGYALRVADLSSLPKSLTIVEEITAGLVPQRTVTSGTATRIMTGAPLPRGADAVVMLEATTRTDESTVRIDQADATVGSHILRQAKSLRRGDTIFKSGDLIRPIEIGVLAEIGHSMVAVQPMPRAAVVATGNELVASDQVPQPGQIRNSNAPMLCALARQAGATAIDLGIGRDDVVHLRSLIVQGLEQDLLVLSGGVSAGVMDLVPSVLQECGVQEIFHKVNLKPGKPLWFGVVRSDDQPERLVFGLPGNPVSSLVCFELFVRPAIQAIAGREHPGQLRLQKATLAVDQHQQRDRQTFAPARVLPDDAGQLVEPLVWHGSADLATLSAANCLIVFPPGDTVYRAGRSVEILRL